MFEGSAQEEEGETVDVWARCSWMCAKGENKGTGIATGCRYCSLGWLQDLTQRDKRVTRTAEAYCGGHDNSKPGGFGMKTDGDGSKCRK